MEACQVSEEIRSNPVRIPRSELDGDLYDIGTKLTSIGVLLSLLPEEMTIKPSELHGVGSIVTEIADQIKAMQERV